MDPIRRADVLRVIGGASGGGAVPPEGMPAGIPSGGEFQLNFDGLERVVSLMERVGPLFERFSERFMAIKEWENGGHAAGGGGFDMIDETGPAPRVVNRPVTPAPAPPAPPHPGPVGAGSIEPIKLYQLLLGTLAQLPPGMTASQALDLAKANKTMVISTIEQQLGELVGDGSLG